MQLNPRKNDVAEIARSSHRVAQQQACRPHLNLKYSVRAAVEVLNELVQLLSQLRANESVLAAHT
jgi:hypothetical protein